MKRKRRLTGGNKWIRKELNALWSKLYEWTPVLPSSRWDMTSSGVRYLPMPAGDEYIPPFSPSLSGLELSITPGYFHGPKSAAFDHEISDYPLYPYKPVIDEVELDAATPNTLTLTAAATNWVYMQVKLQERAAILGDTSVHAGTTGLTVWVETASSGITIDNNSTPPEAHNHDVTDATHDHQAQLDMEQLGYHINESFVPEFLVSTAAVVPVSELLTHRIPWGKYVIAADESVTSEEWYWTGHRDFTPLSWIRSTVTSPHGGGDDMGANPLPA